MDPTPGSDRSVVPPARRGLRLPASASDISGIVMYAACFVATWALLGVHAQLRAGELIGALVLQLLVGAMLLRQPPEGRTSWVVVSGIVMFLGSVALLRDGVRPTPGYSPLVLLPIVWASLRSRRSELLVAIGGAALVLFLPLVVVGGKQYPISGWRGGSLTLITGAVLGVTVFALVAKIRASEETQRRLAVESAQMVLLQDGLRQIATLVAGGAEPTAVFREVAAQVARLFGGSVGGVVRFDGAAGEGWIVGGWSADGADITGTAINLAGPTAAAEVYRTGEPVMSGRYTDRAEEPILEERNLGVAVVAPISVTGHLWGSVGVAFPPGAAVPRDTTERLVRFADLVAVAIANAQAWEKLSLRASSDPLTGLANHRTFHDRLGAEVDRAARYGRALSIVVFDVDHFKTINDIHGHQVGDDVLVAVAERLSACARSGELVARTGGEEFAWLMPETTQEKAYVAAERARRAIESTPFETVGTITISGGICSTEHIAGAADLFSAADQALYRAKSAGRNTTVAYATTGTPAPAATSAQPLA